MLVMPWATEVTMEHFGPGALRVSEDAEWLMERIETFFVVLGANIIRRKPRSIKVELTHPDGFNASVSTKYYITAEGDEGIVDILRRSGDSVLFRIVYRKFVAYDFGRGEWPQPFLDGQMCPRPVLKAHPLPFDLPAFRLDAGGEKRKLIDFHNT